MRTMTESAASASTGWVTGPVRSIAIAGRRFDLSLWEEQDALAWHWTITAPGVLALSGEAATERQAFDDACRAGRTLADLVG